MENDTGRNVGGTETGAADAGADAAPRPELAAALSAAVAAVDREELWEEAEERARETQSPDAVLDAYRRLLAQELPPLKAGRLGKRAVTFYDEWESERQPLIELLGRIVSLDRTAEWAFERLSLLLTMAERWDDLLDLYDRVLADASEASQRAKLLDEAAHIAKDFAGRTDRAIGFLKELQAQRPSDAQIALSLERLLEKQGRYRELITLWSARIYVVPSEEIQLTRARIAAVWLERLNDPAQALTVIETMASETDDDDEVCALLERIVAPPSTPRDVHLRALGLLRQRYADAKRPQDVIRTLEIELAAAEEDGARIALHRALARQLVGVGREAEAIEQLASLLALTPDDASAHVQLVELSERTGAHARLADALAAAASAPAAAGRRRVELRVQAGDVRREALDDPPGAIALYALVLADDEASDDVLLQVARHQSALLDRERRTAERVDVLERLAALAPEADEQRAALGEAARLADDLGQTERALAAWRRRLLLDPVDLEALDAVVSLLERSEQWLLLIDALNRRAAMHGSQEQRRADLVRVAGIHADRLDDIEPAIVIWTQVQKLFGKNDETVDALVVLQSRAGRWGSVAELLEDAADREKEPAREAEWLRRLGDLQRERLGSPARALARYREALEANPRNAGGREGLKALLADVSTAGAAVEALATAYAATDEWQDLLAILEPRLVHAEDDPRRTALLLEAASLHEERGQDQRSALGAMRRAFPLAPEDTLIEQEVLRLARATGAWELALEAYRDADEHVTDDERLAQLRYEQGRILETHLERLTEALVAYSKVAKAQQGNLEATSAVVRVAAKLGKWDDVAAAMVRSGRARESAEPALFEIVEPIAEQGGAWDALAASVTSAVEKARKLAPFVAHDLWFRTGIWHRDRRSDPGAAEVALLRAVDQVEGDPETLRTLAELQRRDPGAPLVDTLLKLADATQDDLAVLHEAADVALGKVGDAEQSRAILQRLLASARRSWEQRATLDAERPPRWYASWGIERLVTLHVSLGDLEPAVGLLLESAMLPFDEAAALELRHRAAEITSRDAHDEARAIDLYRAILADSPTDERASGALADLYERRGQLRDLLALREHELSLQPPPARRLELRIDEARVFGALGDTSARLAALRANLDEEPGHERSLALLADVLLADSRHADLADVLRQQAQELEHADRREAAADLWARSAELSESPIGDVGSAIVAHRRVLALAPRPASIDALARLHVSLGEHAEAAEWLEQLLVVTRGRDHVDAAIRLAQAYAAAERRDRARECLERALADDPDSLEIRDLLAHEYRSGGAWAPLAPLLLDGAEHAHDTDAKLEYLQEAADILRHRLDDIAGAIPILERAATLAPSDRGVRTSLADALRASGRLDDARGRLEGLLSELGRRRPPERARIHYHLGRIAHTQGKPVEALEQLEAAASIDSGDPAILRLLGELATRTGALDRAERAYRALLLTVRRQHRESITADPDERPPCSSEILFELHRIAMSQGQRERAHELLESAFETAAQSETEARRFEDALRARAEAALLLRALDQRAMHASGATAAEILSERSAVLADLLDRVDDAADSLLAALEHVPGSATLHESARALARRAGRMDRYAAKLADLATKALEVDGRLACDLLLKLGNVRETELADPKGAVEIYEQSEKTGERLVESWLALDRLCGQLGDVQGQARALRELAGCPSDELAEAQRIDTLYRLAAIELAEPDTREAGLDRLSAALDLSPDYERAATLLRGTAEAAPDDVKVMALFERIGRAAGDETLLLESLERTAALPDPPPDVFHEAVELCTNRGEDERAETLLRRATDLARTQGRLADAVWALVALAERLQTRGEVPHAVRLLREASAVAEPDQASRLRFQVAVLAAGPLADLPLAAETYETLRERDPADPRAWEPLLDVYRMMGAPDRLERLIAETVPTVLDPHRRAELRFERARLLLDRGEDADAEGALREILDEDPDHLDTAMLLMGLLERSGRGDALAELLSRQFDGAQDRKDAKAVAAYAKRLGALLEPNRSDEAIEVYRKGSDWAPDDAELLRALVRLQSPFDDPRERALPMERLLVLETGPTAAILALELTGIRESLGDDAGQEKALALGFQACPTNEKIRTRLSAWYTARSDWPHLARMLVHDGLHRPVQTEAAAKLREAAVLQREKLADPRAAVETLLRARDMTPHDRDLLVDLSRSRAAAGDAATALDEVSAALGQPGLNDAAKAELLRLRAELYGGTGAEQEALADLEQALAIGGRPFASDLAALLDRRRQRAGRQRERELERATTMRMIEVLTSAGEDDRGRDVLAEWVRRHTDDAEALRQLAERDVFAQRWTDAADSYAQLVRIEDGEGQIEAALRLADACAQAGRPEDARAALEMVHRKSPSNSAIRSHLRDVYEETGAIPELAALCLTDAQHEPDVAMQFDRLCEAAQLFLQLSTGATAAVEAAERAIDLRAGEHRATVLLADAYAAAGRVRAASGLLEEAIEGHKARRSPQLAELQHRMARVARAANDRNLEMAWLDTALATDMQNGEVASELSDVAMELGQHDIALKALRAITLMKNPGPVTRAEAFLRQGIIAHQQGNPRRAAMLAKKALEEDPELRDAHALLTALGDA